MSQYKLDKLDYKILDILQNQGKITNARLSQSVGLSAAPTLERVKKLEQNGYINSYHASLEPKKLGFGLTTFVLVKLTGHRKEVFEIFEKEVMEIEQVIECHQVSGFADFILKIIIQDLANYQELFKEKLCTIQGVDSLNSMVVFNSIKNEKKLPI